MMTSTLVPTAPKESKPINRSIHRSLSPTEELRPSYKDGRIIQTITAMPTPQESVKGGEMFVRRNIPFGMSMVDIEVAPPSPSSSSIHCKDGKVGNTCSSGNGSNVSNLSHVSNSSAEIESTGDSMTTNRSRGSKRSFKEKYIMPLVNRFSSSSRDPLPEASEQRQVSMVKPKQDSLTSNGSSHGNNNNSVRRTQRYDAFSSIENIDTNGPSLSLNTQAKLKRPLNISSSRNNYQNISHLTNGHHNDGEQLLSFAESLVPGKNNKDSTTTILIHHLTRTSPPPPLPLFSCIRSPHGCFSIGSSKHGMLVRNR